VSDTNPHSRHPVSPQTHDALLPILERYGLLPLPGAIETITSGLIHDTYLASCSEQRRVVLQRQHEIFPAAVIEDIEVVTSHLEKSGLLTPRPLRTSDGALHVRDAEGRIWRVLTYLEGTTFDTIASPPAAESTGALVARFHGATATLQHKFHFERPHAHDTARHLDNLANAVNLHERDHDTKTIVPLAREILQAAQARPALPTLPRRITHGDLKTSNVLYDPTGLHARALLDLDTLGWQTIAYELGDALRSWTNPRGESVEDTHFDLAIFDAALGGYAVIGRDLLRREEVAAIVPGLMTVALELAARFCLDAFEQRYFAWDASRFSSRREHNRVRAAGQLCLARLVTNRADDAERIVTKHFCER
jgi:Ser/Thr protein kinase RdoA (MazF antagonist)